MIESLRNGLIDNLTICKQLSTAIAGIELRLIKALLNYNFELLFWEISSHPILTFLLTPNSL